MNSGRSRLAEAIRYALSRWTALTRFLDDGRIDLDTNPVERAIRPVALGRRNALFAGSDGGAGRWAIVASLIETAKKNGVEPFVWLRERQLAAEVTGHQGECMGAQGGHSAPLNGSSRASIPGPARLGECARPCVLTFEMAAAPQSVTTVKEVWSVETIVRSGGASERTVMADSDLGTKRMMAFLALIKSVENKGVTGPEIYHRSFGVGHSFMKMSDHPRKESRAWHGHKSDAAGA